MKRGLGAAATLVALSAAALFLIRAVAMPAPEPAPPWPASAKLDALLANAIEERSTPGAVLLIGRGDRVLHHNAYGRRSLIPEESPAKLDTIYDCASLTKVVVTAPLLMMLVEEGKLRLNDRVSEHLPEFAAGRRIRVRQLLTHYSGLRPDLDLKPVWEGRETGVKMAFAEKPITPPGSRFVYSDINYILLAEIIRKLGGAPLEEQARRRILEPLGMFESTFVPPEDLRGRIAPTERIEDGTILHGVVHDPTTRMMGGISGHAGLFSTAADLARFCRMMLAGGTLDGVRVLSPLTVAQMTTSHAPPKLPARGLGWDIDSPYASPRGDLFPRGSFGHTGYTGPSLWLDPLTKTYVVLMSNRVHPTVASSVVSLRSRVASVVAASLTDLDPDAARRAVSAGALTSLSARIARNGETKTGLDRLVEQDFAPLRGKRIGLITNHSGLDREGRRGVDLFAAADGVELAAIFSPEHGFAGALDQEQVDDSRDAKTGIIVHSLYQPGRRRPTAESLQGLDALVFDIQDAGVRFYTYATTMAYAMEEAARADVEFWVLDRPNPINGVDVGGPMLDADRRSFLAYAPMPVRHGMTIGELASFFNEEAAIGVRLHVVEMDDWRRKDFFDETGGAWVNPSPNLRTLSQALLYPGVALLEGLSNWSVGRGTETPFEIVGADWLDARRIAAELNGAGLAGVRFYPTTTRPTSSHSAGKAIQAVQIVVTDRNRVRPMRVGLQIASVAMGLHAENIDLNETIRLIGDAETLDELRAGEDPAAIWERWEFEKRGFLERRSKYLLY